MHQYFDFSMSDYHLAKRGQALNPIVIIWVVLVLEGVQRMLAQAKEVQVGEKTLNRRPTIMGLEALVGQLGRDQSKEWNYFGNQR